MDPAKVRINLVENGIFPIRNKTLEESTGYLVPGTFQGEGKLLGTACLFIRTSGCNLRCSWIGADGKGSPCDTPYSSHKPERNMMSIGEVIEVVKDNIGHMSHVVVSGGEPTLQTKALATLLSELKKLNLHTTIETNATIFDPDIAEFTNLVSMSPKLSSSTPWEANLADTGISYNEKWANRHERDRISIETIQSYIDYCYDIDVNKKPRYVKSRQHDFQLKFVVSTLDDIREIEEDFLSKLKRWCPDDIVLMPEGVTADHLAERTGWVAQEALKRGWRFTPRLHILMFGKNRYV